MVRLLLLGMRLLILLLVMLNRLLVRLHQRWLVKERLLVVAATADV